ncbi:MAG TPA: hypothetical protein VFM88_07530, partial [Vicinamibacteria bacterium]|nr:hypothetical protein [Vicinamibacteria bacterium]
RLAGQLETLFARITEAHRVISNPGLRVAYDQALEVRGAGAPSPSPGPPQAIAADAGTVSAALNQAEEALASGQPLKALTLASDALLGASGIARRRARLLKAQALLRGAGTRKAAEEELKAALEQDPGHAEAHFELGAIYRDGGAGALAAACYKRALALRPRYAEAQQALAALEAPDAGEGNVLKKLFR